MIIIPDKLYIMIVIPDKLYKIIIIQDKFIPNDMYPLNFRIVVFVETFLLETLYSIVLFF